MSIRKDKQDLVNNVWELYQDFYMFPKRDLKEYSKFINIIKDSMNLFNPRTKGYKQLEMILKSLNKMYFNLRSGNTPKHFAGRLLYWE